MENKKKNFINFIILLIFIIFFNLSLHLIYFINLPLLLIIFYKNIFVYLVKNISLSLFITIRVFCDCAKCIRQITRSLLLTASKQDYTFICNWHVFDN